MLINHSLSPTDFCLPVMYSRGNIVYKVNWFYSDEVTLWKAYKQLKYCNCCYKPLYPIIYEKDEEK